MPIENKHYKFLKDYIVQQCKYYEFVYSPDDEYFPRRELLGYIDAYYDLELINDNEEEKIVCIVERLYNYYQKYVLLFIKGKELEELDERFKEIERTKKIISATVESGNITET